MFVESWKEVEGEAKSFSKHAVLLGHIRDPLGLVKKVLSLFRNTEIVNTEIDLIFVFLLYFCLSFYQI